MIESNPKFETKTQKNKNGMPNLRATAMAALLGMGYASDAQDWSGMLKLLEKGYIHTQDLRRRKL